MFHNIVVAVDGSAPSKTAIQFALQMAGEESARLTCVHVVDVSKIVAMTSSSSIDPSYAVNAARDAGREILEATKAVTAGSKVAVSTELLEGDPVNALLDLVKQSKADLIVMGSHGRTGLSRVILGSVSEGVLRHATIPVLITHAP